MLQKLIHYFIQKPKALFLTDSLGAMLSAILLYGVLRTFNTFFGMPKSTLTFLSILALGLCLYSALCFFLLERRWKPFLSIISAANLLYGVLTIALLYGYSVQLTPFGWAYFTIEITLVFVLAFLEFCVSAKMHPAV